MPPIFRCWFALVLVGAIGSVARAGDDPTKPESTNEPPANSEQAAPVDQVARDKKFAEDLSGVVFAGSYSVTRDGKETPAEMEKYTISRVTKSKGDYWIFVARMQYGKHDLTVPMSLQVKWAGDTPVITLTDLTIPGLGTFTSRVLVYGDRYAGTWQHGKIGGHLWGRLEKLEKPAADNSNKEPGDKPKKTDQQDK
jgi:hypothetical protein